MNYFLGMSGMSLLIIIPLGPSVFSCSGTSAPAPISSAPIPKSSSAPVATPSAPAPSPSGATVAQYGQCGGTTCVVYISGWLYLNLIINIISYTGPTVCASPFTCTVSNQYVSKTFSSFPWWCQFWRIFSRAVQSMPLIWSRRWLHFFLHSVVMISWDCNTNLYCI